MSSFVRFPSAAALLALLLGVAPPARADTAPADDETDAPAIELRDAPPPPRPILDDDGPPPVPRRVHRVRPGLIAAGAATYGASYATAVFLALGTLGAGVAEPCSDCRSHAATAVVPIAGPLLYWWKAPAY